MRKRTSGDVVASASFIALIPLAAIAASCARDPLSSPDDDGSSSGSEIDGGAGSSSSSFNGSSSSSGGSSGTSSGGGASSGSTSSGGGSTSSGGGASSSSSGTAGGSSSGSSSGAFTGDAGPSPGGVPGGIVGVGTTVSGCEIFPPDNPWNVEVDGPNIQIVHTYDSELSASTHLHPDWGGYTSNNAGIPFNVVPSTQAEADINFTLYASESDPGPGGWIGTNPVTSNSDSGETAWPFFVGMEIEGDPSAGGTPGSLPGDQHGLVLLQGASGCMLYEGWNCVVVSAAPFACANGAAFDLTSNALRPAGWTSSDAAGLPVMPGLVKLAEVQAGAITHAIRVTFNTTQNGYIAPATHAAGSEALGSAYPPMGLRLRMKSTTPTSSYGAASQVIMAAMKKYGVLIADNGSDWFFQGDSNDGWNATQSDGNSLISDISGDFGNITGGDFEVVYTGAPVNTGL
jgi:hypothetical protein